MQKYILIDHTSDIMIKAFGEDLEECFENAAYAIFDQTVDLAGVRTSEEIDISVNGTDIYERLFSFLSEMIFIEDYNNLILKEFNVKFEGMNVICHAKGDNLNRNIHRIKSEIKAVTYHMMNINMNEPSVMVVFDI